VWPPTTHNITLAEIEASICYWRGQGKSGFDACSTPGKAQASALEQLYTRLLATHQDGIYTTHLSAREHAALTAGAWKKGRLGPATDIPALRPAKTG
jgi:hypothetical protein